MAKHMATHTQTLVQLTDDLVRLLDERAAHEGASRSKVVRDILEQELLTQRVAELERRHIEGYRRHPQGEPWEDEWGDAEAWSEAVAREAMQAWSREEEHW